VFFIVVPLIIVGVGSLAFFLSDEQKANLPAEILEKINKPN
jgi:hypothetical protein